MIRSARWFLIVAWLSLGTGARALPDEEPPGTEEPEPEEPGEPDQGDEEGEDAPPDSEEPEMSEEDAEAPTSFPPEGEYGAAEPLEVASATFDAFELVEWTPSAEAEPTEGAYLFALRREHGPRYAYRIDAEPVVGEDGTAALALSAFFLSIEDGSTATVGPRVFQRRGVAPEDAPATARRLVEEAEAAADDWARAAQASERTSEIAADPEEADRMRWRAVARSLERARAKHPEHLGILRDLVLSYGRLLPLEIGSPTGTNLALLLPERLREWLEAVAQPTDEEWRSLRRVEAALWFHTGVYPPVFDLLDNEEEDDALRTLGDALAGLGYASFEPLEELHVEGDGPTYHVTPIRAEGEARVPRSDFHRVTFLVRPQDVAGPGAVTFVLAERPLSLPEETPRARWALYSMVGGTKRLVRLYGEAEPSIETVTEQVVALVRAALVAPGEAR